VPRTESAKPVDEQKVAQDTAPVAASADLTLSPAVRRLVLELGIDPTKVKGSGKDGRLTKEDVLAAAKGGAPTSPSTPAAAPVAPLPPLRRLRASAARSACE
jgi:2-oxoglutarate dehydrogenase E2 component (dihydrolipoamide succinyltransferase)